MEIRRDSPTGQIVLIDSTGTTANIYRPVEHYVYIGAPPARAGVYSQTHATMIVQRRLGLGQPAPDIRAGRRAAAAPLSLLNQPGK